VAFDLLDEVEANLKSNDVSIVEFAESEEYCNKRLYPRQRLLLKLIFLEDLTPEEDKLLDYWIAGGRNGNEIEISPHIRERIKYLKENGFKHFREVVLVGGRRSSKGFVTGIALAKIMYDCLQLQDPGRHYGIDPEKEIYFSCVAGSQEQAKEFQFADFVNAVENCKAFEPHLTKSLETEFRISTAEDHRKIARFRAAGNRVQRDIAKLRGKALASNAGTLRGSATMAVAIDEMAHMIEGESKASADQVYDAIDPALDQFGADALMFCNSSPYTKIGKFFERWTEAMAVEEENPMESQNPLMFAIRFPSWALYEGYKDDEINHFNEVIQASPDWDPEERDENGEYVYSEGDRKKILMARRKEQANPDKYKVERRSIFAEVTDAYLNSVRVDIAYKGRPIGFDPNGEMQFEALDTNWGNSSYMFRYKAHLDPSSTTAGFGFALGHSEEFTDSQGNVSEHVVFDIIKRWQPQDFPDRVIVWEEVIDEVMIYADLFRPYEITFDQFDSTAPIQTLQKGLRNNGIGDVRVYEKTATPEYNWKRAEIFKTGLYQGKVHMPHDTDDARFSALELKFLQKKNVGGKFPRVDKQEIGPVQTKDMADCIMEVTHALIGNVVMSQIYSDLSRASLSVGAAGGYQIGGREGLAESGRSTPALFSELYKGRVGEQRHAGPQRNAGLSRMALGRGNRSRGFAGRKRGF
jgi:hypothetical protein